MGRVKLNRKKKIEEKCSECSYSCALCIGESNPVWGWIFLSLCPHDCSQVLVDQRLQIWHRSFKKLICVWSVCRFTAFRFQLCRPRHVKSPPCEKWHSPPWEFSCYKIPFSWLAESTLFPPKHRKLRQIAQTLSLRQDCKPYSRDLTNCSKNFMTAELCKNYHCWGYRSRAACAGNHLTDLVCWLRRNMFLCNIWNAKITL